MRRMAREPSLENARAFGCAVRRSVPAAPRVPCP
jgi:hypothetical protein